MRCVIEQQQQQHHLAVGATTKNVIITMCMYGVRIFYTWMGLHLSIIFGVRCDSIHVSFMSITHRAGIQFK